MIEYDIAVAAFSGIAGVLGGGWLVRWMFSRYMTRADEDHDILIVLKEKVKKCEKDLDYLHEAKRKINEKISNIETEE